MTKHILFEKLKEAINKKIGFRIRSKSDCRMLSSLLISHQVGYLSESTLYRFFLGKDVFRFYPDTLNKLSKFAGKSSWDDFCLQQEENNNVLYSNGILQHNFSSVSLIKTSIMYEAIKPLYAFFESLPTSLPKNVVNPIISELYFSLCGTKKSNINIYKELGGLPFIRTHFFEIGADPDFKIHDYEMGLEQYIKHAQKVGNPISILQDFIFANSLLFRHNIKNNNKHKARKIAEKLFENSEIDLHTIAHIDVFPASRWYAYRLWWAMNWKPNVLSRVEEDLLIFCKQENKKNNIINRKIVCYNALDVLHTDEQWHRMMEIVLKLFSDILPFGTKENNSIQTIMKYIEPNGIKRGWEVM